MKRELVTCDCCKLEIKKTATDYEITGKGRWSLRYDYCAKCWDEVANLIYEFNKNTTPQREGDGE